MRTVLAAVLAAGLALGAGAGSGGAINAAAGPPDFALSATPPSQTVAPGDVASYTVALDSSGGFADHVDLSVDGLPTGATATFTPALISGSDSSTLAVTTAADTPTGSSTLTITGTGGGLTHTATVTLDVKAAAVPDFSLTAAPSTGTVTAGYAASYTVALTSSGGFSDPVGLSVDGLPTGASATFTPASISGSDSSTLAVTTAADTPTGSSTLTITGTSGALTHTATVTLDVQAGKAGDFSLNATPSTRNVAAGDTASYSVSLTSSGGFADPVALSVDGLPTGASATFTPASISGSVSSTLAVTTTSDTPTGTRTLTVTGTSGALTHTATIRLTVKGKGSPVGPARSDGRGGWFARACAAPSKTTAECHADVVTDSSGFAIASSGRPSKASAAASPSALLSPPYGPADLHSAYNLPTQTPAGFPTQTIAIVDAYDDANIASDLATYDAQYGLPDLAAYGSGSPWFRKVDQTGGTSYPSAPPSNDPGWTLEIPLDVETAHAICQNCNVLLVEANSTSFTDLGTAENEAASLGATVISNSYGGSEGVGETLLDGYYNHPGVAITASAGDSGFGVEYPAASPYVTAVGGTTLNLNTNGSYASETAWSGTGSGCSALESKPSWQTDPTCTSRMGTDVSADANPSTGVLIYNTVSYQGQTGWFQVGGTSLAAPLIAAVYALTGAPQSAEYTNGSLPWAHHALLHDVTSGSNGGCGGSRTYYCTAQAGYDGPTGNGTPNGSGAFAADFQLDATPSSRTVDAGSSTTYTVSLPNKFADSVGLSVSGLPTGATADFSPTSISGSATSTLTVTTASTTPVGTSTLTITGTSGSLTHTATVSLTVNPLSCSAGQYTAAYWANETLSGTPVLTQCESAPINYNWGTGGPGGGVPATQFSARWTGQFNFAGGATTFTATTDDGMRVWVDGSLVIDEWKGQPATTYTATVSLTAGSHTVKVEYYQGYGGATAKLDWSP